MGHKYEKVSDLCYDHQVFRVKIDNTGRTLNTCKDVNNFIVSTREKKFFVSEVGNGSLLRGNVVVDITRMELVEV